MRSSRSRDLDEEKFRDFLGLFEESRDPPLPGLSKEFDWSERKRKRRQTRRGAKDPRPHSSREAPAEPKASLGKRTAEESRGLFEAPKEATKRVSKAVAPAKKEAELELLPESVKGVGDLEKSLDSLVDGSECLGEDSHANVFRDPEAPREPDYSDFDGYLAEIAVVNKAVMDESEDKRPGQASRPPGAQAGGSRLQRRKEYQVQDSADVIEDWGSCGVWIDFSQAKVVQVEHCVMIYTADFGDLKYCERPFYPLLSRLAKRPGKIFDFINLLFQTCWSYEYVSLEISGESVNFTGKRGQAKLCLAKFTGRGGAGVPNCQAP